MRFFVTEMQEKWLKTVMKFTFVLAGILLISGLQSPALLAETVKEIRSEAQQHEQQGDFGRAFKDYLKLAKAGDQPSQERVAKMYANGEGKKVDLTKAYAWAVVAAEGGKESMVKFSESLLPRTRNPAKAEKKAAKYIKKYGRETQQRKAEQAANRDPSRCIGSLLACKRR